MSLQTRLALDNRGDLMTTIVTDDLSKTLQGVVYVTRKLGISVPMDR